MSEDRNMISDEAVDAAAKGFAPHWDGDGGWFAFQEFLPKLRGALEAAAPHMLREAYDLGFRHGSNEPTNPHRSQG